MSYPQISVIIPTFNRKLLCHRAVSSVIKQSYTDYELIIVDDGSEDGTTQDYLFSSVNGSLPDKIQYLRNDTNRGVSYSRNRGVASSSGEWIAFLDSDDVWHEKKLENQIIWLRNNPGFNICQTREVWIRNGIRVNPPVTHEKTGGQIFRESLDRCMITPSSVMIHRQLLAEAGGFNESMPACEDYELWLRITLYHQVGLVDKYLLTRYGGHEDQLSAKFSVMDKFRVRALLFLLEYEKPDHFQKKLIYQTLVKKSDIVAQGFKKRNRIKEYERFKGIADTFRQYL